MFSSFFYLITLRLVYMQITLAAAAADLCRQSGEAYSHVVAEGGGTREDALVNMANALTSWAEYALVGN